MGAGLDNEGERVIVRPDGPVSKNSIIHRKRFGVTPGSAVCSYEGVGQKGVSVLGRVVFEEKERCGGVG